MPRVALKMPLANAILHPQFHSLLLPTSPERVFLPNLLVFSDEAAEALHLWPLFCCHRLRYGVRLIQLVLDSCIRRQPLKPPRLIPSIKYAASFLTAFVSRVLLVLELHRGGKALE